MKQNQNFRLTIVILLVAIGFFFLENKRKEHKSVSNKPGKKITREADNVNVSNTDYIFFESVSKYLFISQ